MSIFHVGPDGYLLNSGAINLIQPELRPLLAAMQDACCQHMGDALISLYVRGSVSAGRAYLGTSDVDLVLITHDVALHQPLDWVRPTTSIVQEQYPLTSEIDLTILALQTLLHSPIYTRLRVYMSTQSALLTGSDIRDNLPRFRPDRSLAQYMHPDIQQEISHLRSIFTGQVATRDYGGIERPNSFWCVWTMRTLLRSAELLAMVSTGIYECDLKACKNLASETHAILRSSLEQAYTWALSPTDDATAIVTFLDNYLSIFLPFWYREVLESA